MSPPPPDDQAPPARPTSHRAAPTTPEVVRRLAPPLTAVVAVATVILLLLVLNSRPATPGPAPGAVAEPSGTDGPRTTPATSVTTATPSASAPPVSEPPATQAPTQAPATQVSAASRPPVTVLNNSRRSGLAHQVAAQVQAKGWPVRDTGNFRGRVAETTLYYAPGQHAAAAALGRALPQIRRVKPRFSGLPGVGLTLVVTRDWSG